MAHTSSAEKSLRQTEKRRVHNRAVKKAIKTEIKKGGDKLTPEANNLLLHFHNQLLF